jgi:hypothetical protein
MTQAIHIFKKDARRLRWALVGWSALVLARTILAVAGADIVLKGAKMEAAVGQLEGMMGFAYGLFEFVLISRLVHDEPLVSRTAFWITRPIVPGALMSAKLAFAALFFLLLPLLSSVVIVASYGTDLRGIAQTIPVFILNHLTITTLMFTLAVLTPSLVVAILSLLGIIVGVVLVFWVLAFGALFIGIDQDQGVIPRAPEHTVELIRAVLIVLAGLAVVWYQYRYRRVGRAIALAAGGLLAVVFVPEYWPWSLTSYPVEATAVRPNSSVSVSINPDKVSVSDASGSSTPLEKEISAPLTVTGVPSDVYPQTVTVSARLEFADRTVLQPVAHNRLAATLSDPASTSRTLESALGGIRLLTAPPIREGGSSTASPMLLTVNEEQFRRRRSEPGRLTAEVDVIFETPVVRATLPLAESASADIDDVRLEIRRMFPRPTGRAVVFRRSSVESLLMVPRYRQFTVVLVNRGRGEGLEGDRQHGSSFALTTAELYMSSPWVGGRGFAFDQYEMTFTARRSNVGWIDLDQAWFDGATVVVLEFVNAGSVTRTVTVDKFQMTP